MGPVITPQSKIADRDFDCAGEKQARKFCSTDATRVFRSTKQAIS